jgi:hypothetical protein
VDATPTTSKRLTQNERKMLDLLTDGMSLKDWKKAGSEVGALSVLEDYKARHRVASRAIQGLVDKTLVVLRDEKAFLPGVSDLFVDVDGEENAFE